MLEMKWITKADGRMIRTWDEAGEASTSLSHPNGETSLQTTGSAVFPACPIENDFQGTSDIPKQSSPWIRAVRSKASPCSQGGNWTRVYSILRRVLPQLTEPPGPVFFKFNPTN